MLYFVNINPWVTHYKARLLLIAFVIAECPNVAYVAKSLLLLEIVVDPYDPNSFLLVGCSTALRMCFVRYYYLYISLKFAASAAAD